MRRCKDKGATHHIVRSSAALSDDTTSELALNAGARTYPAQYGFDTVGHMTNLTTWQDYAGQLRGQTRVLTDAISLMILSPCRAN